MEKAGVLGGGGGGGRDVGVGVGGGGGGGVEGRPTVATVTTALAAAFFVLEAGRRVASRTGLAGGSLGKAVQVDSIKTRVLKAPIVSALDTIISQTAFMLCVQLRLLPLHLGIASLFAPFVAAAAAAAFKHIDKSKIGRGGGGGGGVGAFSGGDVVGGALMLAFFAALGAGLNLRL